MGRNFWKVTSDAEIAGIAEADKNFWILDNTHTCSISEQPVILYGQN